MEELIASPVVRAVAGLVILALVIRWLYGVFNKPKVAGVFLKMTCKKCKWSGTVGKYNQRCPQCNSTQLSGG